MCINKLDRHQTNKFNLKKNVKEADNGQDKIYQ